MKKNLIKNKLIVSLIFCFIMTFSAFSMPFLGGYYLTENSFYRDNLATKHVFSFYINQKFNDYFRFYTRITAGFEYFANYFGYSNNLTNFSFIPNIDLFYFEFKSRQKTMLELTESNSVGVVNYHFFLFRIGRIHANLGSGFFFNMKGDGCEMYFTLKNFRFSMIGVTNSFDFLPFFDFNDESSSPVFTPWDNKRYPKFSNYLIPGNNYGFIGDITSTDYNFYFNYDDFTDYTVAERTRLNKVRFASVMAGRIFAGFSAEFFQLYFQNLSFSFLANIDLIPNEFIVTYPSQQIINTFGGKYNSFYFSLNANGKIYAGLFYNIEVVYETGFNATYYFTGGKVIYRNELINSFAISARLSYYFNHPTKPSLHVFFQYAHGDADVEFRDGAVINRNGQDNNYKSPNSPYISYVMDPYFSNIIVVGISQTIKPAGASKNPIFSRFSIESVVSLMLRPVIKGKSFLGEQYYYYDGQPGYEDLKKIFLGGEIDINFLWQVFSDLSFQVNTGIFIPNYFICRSTDVFWKAGFTLNISF